MLHLKSQPDITSSIPKVVALHYVVKYVKIVNSCTIKVCIGAIPYWSMNFLVIL